MNGEMNTRPINLRSELLLSLLLGMSTLILAERPPIKTYTTADGLVRDEVGRIVRDSKGFLWFCTTEGLSRYDGYTFTNFGPDQGVPGRIVNDLIETHSGVYWVATSKGLCRFRPEPLAQTGTGAGTRFVFDYSGEDTRGRAITTVLEDHTGVVWFGGPNGLFRLDQHQGKWVCSRVDLKDAAASSGSVLDVRGLLEDRRGALWISASSGLYRRRPDGVMERFGEREGISGAVLGQALLEDRGGQIWIGTVRGLYQLVPQPAPNSGVVARVYTTTDGLANNHINALFQASDGGFWVGDSEGLSEMLSAADNTGRRFRNYTAANGLSDIDIGAINEDRDGNLWLGTENGGAMKLAANGFTTYGESDGLRSTRIGALLINKAGEFCVISNLGSHELIHRFNGRRFEAVELSLPSGFSEWGWAWYQKMFQARTGEWWVQMTHGVVRYPVVSNLSQLAHVHPQSVFTKREGLLADDVFRIYEDSRGDVWIGALSSEGHLLTRWERRTETFREFTTRDGLQSQSAPSAFCEDGSGNLWIGFYNGGLARYSVGRFTTFTIDDGLPAGFVRGIYLDHLSRLWIATAEGGVARLDNPQAARPRFAVYNTTNGLSSNQATAITEDQWGRIYIGTGRGVDRLDPASGALKHYTTADGLASSFINVALRDREGALWFGTLNGLSRLIPQLEGSSPPPPIMINDLRTAGGPHPLSSLGETAVEGLVLGADQNQLRIGFFGLSFGLGETLRYQYKLEGAQSDWSSLTEQREVNFANLGPGSYRFLVRAVTADGIASESPATVAFQILQPVWRRWWFLSIVAVLLASAVIAFDRYRAARLNELGAALDEARSLTKVLTAHQAELRKANDTLTLEYDVTRVLAEAATPAEAAPKVLRAICESGGWEVGALWDVDREVNVLRCLDVWHQPNVNAAQFEAMSREQVFVPGVGLPGRVLQSGEAHWISDLAHDPNFPRLVVAAKEGLKSAFAFPILIESEVIGVIEFFSSEPRQPDAEQIRSLSAIGSHIGQVIERKRTEEALSESENRFRTLAETASDAIITIDEHSTIVFANPATASVFGHSLAEMIGEELTMLMPEYVRHLHRAGFSRYLQTGHRHLSWEAIELPGLHKSGREIPLEVSFGEFTKNNLRFFTGIVRDISERKRAEEELQRSREERLIELERVRRRIATDLHDDIGSSLTQIAILSEVIRQRVGEDESTVSEPLSMIAGASRELVDSMSDIVWAINPQKDHLSDLTQRMRRFAADSFTARNITFQLSLPEVEEDMKLGANLRREVFLIFKESINNIVRHAGCTEAEIKLRFAADKLILNLRDNGCGFDVASESDGHGLVSMRDRAQGIGGQLELISKTGHGTSITLQVPLNHPTHPIS
jgi:PAS domain S-box-containing protein